jgi:hypothetical protein
MSLSISMDRLRLSSNAAVLKMIRKKGTEDEQVVFSAIVEKVNKRGKAQTRVLMITSRAAYNLSPNELAKCKRRIALEDIQAVYISTLSNEMIVHVPAEYDYKLITDLKEHVANLLIDLIDRYQKRKLKVSYIKAENIPFFDGQNQNNGPEEKNKVDKQDKDDDDNEQSEELINSKEKVSLKSFELLNVVGKGAFGKVVKVKKKDTGNVYAMKILKKKFIYENQQVESTLLERNILAAFNNPFINVLRYAFQTKEKLYFVMDYYQGGELYHHLEKVTRFSEEEARFIAAEVTLAVGHLHSLHFIYRDL